MLINLINDLLDHAKMEKNKFQLNYSFFNLAETIKMSINSLSFFSQQKNIEPELIIDPLLETLILNVNGDEARISQIILNFLSNAFKFTPSSGKISIEIKTKANC